MTAGEEFTLARADKAKCTMNSSNKNSSTSKIKCLPYEDWMVNFDNALRYMRWLLRVLGIWYLVGAQPIKIEKYLSKLILPFTSITMISLTVPIWCYIIFIPIDRLQVMLLLAPIFCQTANILMHSAMIIRSGTLKICVEHMRLDWQRIENSTEHEIMTRHVRYSHSLTIACIAIMYTGALSYSLIIPLAAGNTINELNETLRPRPFPGTEIFFNVQANIVYEIVFTVNFISAIFHYTVITAVCNLAIVLVSHTCGQIQVVIWNLESFVDQLTKNNQAIDAIMERIGFIVQRHVRLLKFSANIEKALKEIFLIEVVSSTLIICFIEYYVLALAENVFYRLEMVTYVVLFGSFTFNLFLYCKFGEVLKEQSQEVGNVAYMTDWYKLPPKTQLAFLMVIRMGDYPCKLTAGGIMELSIASFASIIKTSLAYFNMMRTMG